MGVIVGLLAGYYTFSPKIFVYPASSLDPKNPFKTPFILENESLFAIYSVQWAAALTNVLDSAASRMNHVRTDSYMSRVTSLYPHRKTAIEMWMPIAFHYPILTATAVIEVRYRPKFYTRKVQETFRFHVATNSVGEAIWLPEGQ